MYIKRAAAAAEEKLLHYIVLCAHIFNITEEWSATRVYICIARVCIEIEWVDSKVLEHNSGTKNNQVIWWIESRRVCVCRAHKRNHNLFK